MTDNCLIAVITEDETDYKVVRKIIHRVLDENIKTKKWSSKGCGKLKRKLEAHLLEMSKAGYNTFIIVHDLDRNPENNSPNDESELRKKLESSSSVVTNKHICIPIEEMEAWFWSDPEVIKHIGKGKGSAKPNPHLISQPKEKLIELSKGENRKPRYSNNMNVELAEMLDLEICADRCPSFKDLVEFLKSLKPVEPSS
jgi:Domain of unknown function (DUF4276)